MTEHERGRREFLKLAGLSAVGAGIATGCGGGVSGTGERIAGGDIDLARSTDLLIVGAGGAGGGAGLSGGSERRAAEDSESAG